MSVGAITVSDVSVLPESQPATDDLSKLIPAVVPIDEADAELVAIGERYWALAGFAPDLGTPVWCEKVKDINTGGWGHQIYAVAAPCAGRHRRGRAAPPSSAPARTAHSALWRTPPSALPSHPNSGTRSPASATPEASVTAHRVGRLIPAVQFTPPEKGPARLWRTNRPELAFCPDRPHQLVILRYV